MKVLAGLFFMMPIALAAQNITIDFEDGNISQWLQSNSEHWCVSDVNTINGNYSLRHCFDSDIAAFDWITYFHQPLVFADTAASWEFSLRYDFNPSSNNCWVVLLSSGSLPDEEGNIQDGLIVGVNYEGNSDELMIWKVKDKISECLLNTNFNWETYVEKGQNVKFHIEFLDQNGNLRIDIGDQNYIDLGNFIWQDTEPLSAFTLFYKYSASYDMGLWLDDFIIKGKFTPDTISPAVKFYSFVNPNTIELDFTELVQMSATECCIDGIGCCSNSSGITSALILDFPNPMKPGYEYNLSLPEIVDMYGNELNYEDGTFKLYYPGAYDIVISEIMADPDPPVLLPDVEYVELFNTTEKDIYIKDWLFTANNRKAIITEMVIPSKTYFLVCDDENKFQFESDNNIIGINNFPALSNSGADLVLQDRSGKLIDAVTYNNDWYATSDKKAGGWSLEMINPYDACIGSVNWKESEDYRGGSPAGRNSVYNTKTRNPDPELWRAAITDSGSLMLYFSEPLDSGTLISPNYYCVNRDIGIPLQVIPAWPLADRVKLVFDKVFLQGTEYTINLTADLCDCSGLRISQTADYSFTIPEKADSADILINEILFDPEIEHIEFIELYNISSKTADLRNYRLILSDRNDTGKVITNEYWPLKPGAYCLIANDYKGIDTPGKFNEAEKIVFMPDMPALPNTGSTLYLKSNTGKIIDATSYSPDWHHEILIETKGVSLERISSDKSGLDPSNWQSASSDAGYMTPAAPNSQSMEEIKSCSLDIEPETITPNDDGMDDDLNISYILDEEGYMGRVILFDVNGRKCRTLANGTLLGTSGEFIFDGRSEDHLVLPTGYYIVFFEAYNRAGKRFTSKKPFVIAR